MRIVTVIALLLTFLSCKKEVQNIIPEFTEEDAYDITNKLKRDIIVSDNDSIVYWYRNQVVSPPMHIDFDEVDDEIPVTAMVYDFTPFPKYTTNEWDMNKLEGVEVVEKEEFGYYFKENDSVSSIDLEKQWDLKFKGNTVHHVSYPIYSPQSKVAVIRDFVFEPFLHCGTDSKRDYLYKKVNGHWEKM